MLHFIPPTATPTKWLASSYTADWALGRSVPSREPIWPRRVETHPKYAADTSLLGHCHTLILLSVFPCTVLWYPILRSSAFGNLVLLDLVYLALWATTLALVVHRNRLLPLGRRLANVCVFAVLAGLCSIVGTVLYGQTASLVTDLLRHMRICGFPSIIPLSMYVASRERISRWVTISALLSITFSIGIQLTGYQERLPLFQEFSRLNDEQMFRPTGAVSNPNEFGYMSMLGFAFAIVLYLTTRKGSGFQRVLCLVAAAAALWGVIISASRSAIVGILCGVIYYFAKQRMSSARKLVIVGLLLSVLVIGWRTAPVFQDRMNLAMTQRLGEANVAGRLDAQLVALRTWCHWPLGVGFSNRIEATSLYLGEFLSAVEGSDNIYVDYLLSAGIQGLAFLLLCFAACWRLVRVVNITSRTAVLQAAIVGVLACGFGSVAPAMMFLAPFFFAVVGTAALPERELRTGRRW